MLGLLEASRNYDQGKGAAFETYAAIRIKGFMLDEIRRNGWLPRSVYRNARLISEAVRKVENQLGRTAKDSEIAAELHISLNNYFHLLQDSTGGQLYGFDDVGVSDEDLKDGLLTSEPQDAVIRQDLIHHLSNIISKFPKKEQLVLSLYYEQELNLKEIGEVLSITESRVSQIHTQAMIRIKARLNNLNSNFSN
jgi:RNA polymerase sigma factor FliA